MLKFKRIMKSIILVSKRDSAGVNIAENLKKLKCKYEIKVIDNELIYSDNIDKQLDCDFVVFASKHKSQKHEKTFSVHTIGNFGKAEFGGKPETLCQSSAVMFKHFFQTLHEISEGTNSDYKLTLEATHHGPYVETPSLFIEIGSTKYEWNDEKAGEVIAKTIIKSLTTFKEQNFKTAFGVGGPHYCPNFNDLQLNSDYAISFLVPKYALPLNENLLNQLIEKTVEKAKIAIIDWKGFSSSEERSRTIELIKNFGVEIIKTKGIKG